MSRGCGSNPIYPGSCQIFPAYPLELNAAKILQGVGQISNAERDVAPLIPIKIWSNCFWGMDPVWP
jgi:hypothetical protein